MNDNVIHACFNKKVTAAPANRRYVMGYHSPLPAAWPAWVVANKDYREKCVYLLNKGWKIDIVTKDVFHCSHPQVQSKNKIHLEGAWRIQLEMDESHSGGRSA